MSEPELSRAARRRRGGRAMMRWCCSLAARHGQIFQDPGGPETAFFIFGSDKILEQWIHKRAESHKTTRRANHRRRPWHFVELLRRADGRLGLLGARNGEGKIVFRSYDDWGRRGLGPLSSAGGGMPWMMATEGMVDDERTDRASTRCVRWLPGRGRRASRLRKCQSQHGSLLPRPQSLQRTVSPGWGSTGNAFG